MRTNGSVLAHVARIAHFVTALTTLTAFPGVLRAQARSVPGGVLEAYVTRADLHPGLAGNDNRTKLDGLGARLLLPLHQLTGSPETSLASRLSVGGFFTMAPAREAEGTARHYGIQTDMLLSSGPMNAHPKPLISLGVGAFNSPVRVVRQPSAPPCLRPSDLPLNAALEHCAIPRPTTSTEWMTDLALSPALGARVGISPSLALRVDARDVIVYRGGPRHTPELSVGFSLLPRAGE